MSPTKTEPHNTLLDWTKLPLSLSLHNSLSAEQNITD